MLQINFYPESGKDEFIKAAKEYKEIWSNDGQRIIELIQRYSSLTFTTKIINAVTFEGISYSTPMQLRSSYPYKHKEATLIHELLHRLLMDNNYLIGKNVDFNEEVHKIIDLILYDIWTELLGETIAKESKEIEIGYGNPAYKNSWDWALSFSKEERTTKFLEMRQKYQKGSNSKPL